MANEDIINHKIIAFDYITLNNIKQIEYINDKIYYIKNDNLYIYQNGLSKQIDLENKIPKFIFNFNNLLFIFIKKEDSKFSILNFNENICSPNINVDVEDIKGYFCINHDFIIFYTSNFNDISNVMMFDKNLSIKYIEVDREYDCINCIVPFKKEIYLALHKPGIVVSSNINDIITKFNTTGDSIKIKTNDACEINCFNIITNDNNIFYAPDGPSILKDKENQEIFKDEKEYESGYQISASAILKFDNSEYNVIGTWRRNEEHPLPCLYLLKNCKYIYKNYDKNCNTGNIKAWTGFNSYNKNVKESKIAFSNTAGKAILIKAYKNFDKFVKENDITNYRPEYINKEIIIFNNGSQLFHNIDKKEIINIDYITPEKPSNFYITIDVEQKIPGGEFCITGKGLEKECGIYYIMDVLEKNNLKGVFFVNIYEHGNYDGLIEKIIIDIDKRGHEVGLHCHQNYSDFYTHNLTYYDYEGQKKIIEYGINFIKNIIKKIPFSFRAGAYEINKTTFQVLNDLKIKLDSSVFLGVDQDLLYKSKNSICTYGNTIEVPITTILTNNTISKIDINWQKNAKKMINEMLTCHNYGLRHIVTMLHSFSFLTFTKNKKEAIVDFEFTGKRFIKGVNISLMNEFETFCFQISKLKEFYNRTFFDAYEKGEIPISDKDIDCIPRLEITKNQKGFCPICNSSVEFQPYRNRKGALCPVCHSLERMRFKMIYLKKRLNIDNCDPKRILHFGPALNIRNYISKIVKHDYISSDPYNEADFKFSIEKIPFDDNHFDLIICVGVLMHVLDDRKAIKEMYRVLKKGGELLLWLGDLNSDTTKESYDRKYFSRMKVGNVNYPENLGECKTEEKNGIIYYNPRFRTRVYGKDVIICLKDMGFEVDILMAKRFINCKKYGINEEETLISCKK